MKHAMKNDTAETQTLAEQKMQLLLISQTYRIGILQGQMTVVRSLQTRSLIESAVEHAVGFAGARLGAMTAGKGGLKSLVPLALASFSYLSGKRLIKPVIGTGLVLVAVMALFWRRNRANAAECESDNT